MFLDFCSFHKRLYTILGGKSLLEYPINTGVLRESIVDPNLFLPSINNLHCR